MSTGQTAALKVLDILNKKGSCLSGGQLIGLMERTVVLALHADTRIRQSDAHQALSILGNVLTEKAIVVRDIVTNDIKKTGI